LLPFVTLVDELWSGVVVSGAPSVEHELGLSHRAYVAFVFAIPLIIAALLEAGVAFLSDVWGRERLVVLGQGVLAMALLWAAWTADAWGLAVGLALAGASSGVACGATQALLVVSHRGDADRAMVRWTLFGAIGDLLTPFVTAAAIALGYSYRGAMMAIAAVVSAQCVGFAYLAARRKAVAARPRDAEQPKTSRPSEPLRAVLARASRNSRLWVWLFAAATCTLLDELVVALAALRMERDQGATEVLATAAAVTFSAGALLGAAMTDRAVARLSPRRVLVASGIVCALALGAFLATRSALESSIALFAVGIACAPHHALAQASAYKELPDNPGTVQAIAQIFVVIDVIAPLALGAAADRYGLSVAIGCLLAQPVVIVACAAVLGRNGACAPGGLPFSGTGTLAG
jgi:MFS family permease